MVPRLDLPKSWSDKPNVDRSKQETFYEPLESSAFRPSGRRDNGLLAAVVFDTSIRIL
jgi:hypothetical protein